MIFRVTAGVTTVQCIVVGSRLGSDQDLDASCSHSTDSFCCCYWPAMVPGATRGPRVVLKQPRHVCGHRNCRQHSAMAQAFAGCHLARGSSLWRQGPQYNTRVCAEQARCQAHVLRSRASQTRSVLPRCLLTFLASTAAVHLGHRRDLRDRRGGVQGLLPPGQPTFWGTLRTDWRPAHLQPRHGIWPLGSCHCCDRPRHHVLRGTGGIALRLVGVGFGAWRECDVCWVPLQRGTLRGGVPGLVQRGRHCVQQRQCAAAGQLGLGEVQSKRLHCRPGVDCFVHQRNHDPASRQSGRGEALRGGCAAGFRRNRAADHHRKQLKAGRKGRSSAAQQRCAG